MLRQSAGQVRRARVGTEADAMLEHRRQRSPDGIAQELEVRVTRLRGAFELGVEVRLEDHGRAVRGAHGLFQNRDAREVDAELGIGKQPRPARCRARSPLQ